MLLRFSDVHKSYGAFEILNGVSFQVNEGDKLGLIGNNGTGKTTLLHLIENPTDADTGTIALASGLVPARLEQHTRFGTGSVLEEALGAFEDLRSVERSLRDLESRMHAHPTPDVLEEYARLQHVFEAGEGYSYRARTESALFGLGFRREQLSQAARTLSGGEQSRLALACLLLRESRLILLDEPTNHLDIRSIEWLETFLADTRRSLIIVSHDRYFLDRVVGGILELDRGQLTQFKGNYTAYLEQREARLASEEKQWKKQQDWITATETFIQRNIAGQKTRQAQSRRKALERRERVRRPTTPSPAVRFRFGETRRSVRHVIQADKLTVGHVPESPLTPPLSLDIERGQRWAVLGANGSGKTTLLETLVGRRDPILGTVELHESDIGYYDQQLGGLTPDNTVLDQIRLLDPTTTDGELRSFLAGFLFQGEAVEKRVRDLSGGERSRLVLAGLIYSTPPVLVLDEPTNHLDIAAREALEPALRQYPGTLVFVTHDRRLVERVATHILYLSATEVLTFDSFFEFEAWLANDISTRPAEPVKSEIPERPRGPGKNKRERIRRKVTELEARITAVEEEIQTIETVFQDPPPELEWAEINKRYADLREQADLLYVELGELEDTEQAGC